MRLKRLRLSGFKSFCDETEFQFGEQGINVVLGPNGCGKSNVADAIRWALGEQSPRQLRGGTMGDVIFGGSLSRKPIGRCEVVLTFDNSDEISPEFYRGLSEIAVTRRLYRTGESEYLINGVRSRLMDIRDLVMDTGIAGGAYAIVEQGRVDQFITASPSDRRIFVEEVAGIVRYRTRRQTAEKKLEQTDQNLLRTTDLLGELCRQEEALRDQVAQAREYATLREKVQALTAELSRTRYRASEQERNRLQKQHAKLTTEHGNQERTAQLLETQLESLQTEQSLLEQQLKRTRAVFHEKERESQRTESRLALGRQNRAHTQQWIRDLESRLAESHTRLTTLHQERREATERSSALQEEQTTLKAAIAEAEQQFVDKEASAQKVTAHLQTLQEQLLECHTNLTGYANQRQFLTERCEEWQRRSSALEQSGAAQVAEQDRATARESELRHRGTQLKSKADANAGHLADLERALEAENTALKVARDDMGEVRRLVADAAARLRALSEVDAAHEGLEESVRNLLDWAAREPEQAEALGLVGPLAKFVKVPASTLDWAGAALAPLLDVVIVRQAAAIPALEKVVVDQQMGRVRFAPLDALGASAAAAGAVLPDSLATEVSLDAAVASLGAILFGGIRRMPTGRMAYPRPLSNPGTEWLAADGRFHLDHRGTLGLGALTTPTLAVLRRRNEMALLDEQVQALESEAVMRGKAVDAAQARHGALEAEREALRQSQQALALERSMLEQQAQHAASEVKRLTHARGALAVEQEQVTRDLVQAQQQQTALESAETETQARRIALEEEAAVVRETSTAARDAASVLSRELNSRQHAHGQVLSRLDHLHTRLVTLEQEIEALAGRIAETEADQARQREQLGAHGEAIAVATDALSRLQAEQTAGQREVRALSGRYDTGEQHRMGLARQLKSAQATRERAQSELHELDLVLAVEQSRMEQAVAELIQLGLMESAQPDGTLGPPEPSPPRETPLQPSANEWPAQLCAEVASPITPRPEDIAADPKLAGLSAEELEKRMRAGNRKLAAMGSVNLTAPEEYEAIQERLTFLETQKSDLETACDDLRESIRRMNQESRRRFKDTFERVNETFQGVFPDVFGGGEAKLVLTDAEDLLLAGVDIVVQPPGKKLQNLTLLSGGEKALTAIALIFSFFLIKPSPFCLLDEVDAPLDDANVGRFNRLVRSMTDRTQFIIITHNRLTMESGNQLFGITMEEAGVSKLVSVQLADQPA